MAKSRKYRREQPRAVGSVFDGMKGDYASAKTSRLRKQLTGVSYQGSGADYHYRSDSEYLRIMEWARDFDRNDCIVGQALTRLVDNVLQQGIPCDPQTGNAEFDARAKELWGEWTEDADLCDLEQEKTFHEQAKLALRAVMVDGDVFHALLNTGQIQHFEAHRVRTPTNTTRDVILGILLNEKRQRKEAWVTKENVNPSFSVQRVSDMQRYPFRDSDGNRQILHQYLPRRLSQTRGISALAPIMDMTQIHNDLHFVQLVKAQVTACVTFFREISSDSGPVIGGEAGGAQYDETQADGTMRIIEEIAPGMEITGRPGEKLHGFSPNVPNPEFFQHMMAVLNIIAVNLHMPVQVLLLDPTKTNFSGWRGAIEQARTSWRALQRDCIDSLYSPVYRWKIRQWLASDPELASIFKATSADFDPFRVGWNPPYWPYIDPSKDATADANIIEKGLNSRRNVLGRRGLDIDAIDKMRIADRTRFILECQEAATSISVQVPGVTWHDIAREKPLVAAQSQPKESEEINGA